MLVICIDSEPCLHMFTGKLRCLCAPSVFDKHARTSTHAQACTYAYMLTHSPGFRGGAREDALTTDIARVEASPQGGEGVVMTGIVAVAIDVPGTPSGSLFLVISMDPVCMIRL